VGRDFLQEQIDDAEAHDLERLIARITCPLLIMHGDADPTVPVHCAEEIVAAATTTTEHRIIAGADHVFNTPNPMPANRAPSAQLQELLAALSGFALRCCSPVRWL
jgi:pimeloyl-ACP methyl ester carboxylesterase